MTDNILEINLVTTESDFDMRLDQYLAQELPEYSRSSIKKWIEDGLIFVNGVAVLQARYKIKLAEKITGTIVFVQQVDNAPENIALDILYEDDDIIVINKPANLVVHPGAGNQKSTLLNALLYHDSNLDKLPRAGIVHRLDKDTTGVMIVAKTIPAQTKLVQMISEKAVIREYNAIVLGNIIAGGSIEEPIGRDSKSRIKMAVHHSGKDALTHYRVVEHFRHSTLLRIRLSTGRTHQIRVHMAHIGYPVLGDQLYGLGKRPLLPKHASEKLRSAIVGFRRQALHSVYMKLNHPITGELLEFHAPLPADIENLITLLREDMLINNAD